MQGRPSAKRLSTWRNRGHVLVRCEFRSYGGSHVTGALMQQRTSFNALVGDARLLDWRLTVTRALLIGGALLIGIAVALDTQQAAVILAACIVAVCLVVAPAELMLWVVVALVAIFPGTAYGQASGSVADTLFSRGTGVLPASIFNIALMFAAVVCLVRHHRFAELRRLPLMLLFGLVLAYAIGVLVAVASGFSLTASLTGTGGLGLVIAACAAIVTVSAVQDAAAAQRLTTLIQVLGVYIAAFGLARFVWAGGDPSDPYLDYSGINVHLTYYENAYAFVMTAALWSAALHWIPGSGARPKSKTTAWLIVDVVTIALTTAAILLTFRRTNYLAIVVGAGCLVVIVRRARWLLVVGTAAAVASFNLLQQARDFAGSWIVLFESSGEDPRKNELLLAWDAVSTHPFGQGVFGHYGGTPGPGWPATPEIVHDVFLWIGLKLGIVGVVLIVLVLCSSFVRLAATSRSDDDSIRSRSLLLLALFGAWSIAFAVSTPLLEARLAVLFGVWLGLAVTSSADYHHATKRK